MALAASAVFLTRRHIAAVPRAARGASGARAVGWTPRCMAGRPADRPGEPVARAVAWRVAVALAVAGFAAAALLICFALGVAGAERANGDMAGLDGLGGRCLRPAGDRRARPPPMLNSEIEFIMNEAIKKLALMLAKKAGYTILPTWQIENYPAVRHLRRLFDLLSIDCVIDIGANTGQFRDALRDQLNYTGRIVSFEPVPHLARNLAERAEADPLWTVDPRAVGSALGVAEFNIMADTQFSSFHLPRHDDTKIFKESNSVIDRISVEITTLDASILPLMDKYKPRGIFLKIDTQGFDLEALKGGLSFLPHVAALQMEASIRPIYEGAPSHREIIDYASERGFVMSGIFPNNEFQFPEMIEFDCYMIRRDRPT